MNIRESGWSAAGQGSGTGEKSRGATRSESGGNGAARFRLLGIGFGNGRGKVESGAFCRGLAGWLDGWLVGRSVGRPGWIGRSRFKFLEHRALASIPAHRTDARARACEIDSRIRTILEGPA